MATSCEYILNLKVAHESRNSFGDGHFQGLSVIYDSLL